MHLVLAPMLTGLFTLLYCMPGHYEHDGWAGRPSVICNCCIFRPVVKGADDASNFDDYTLLPPMQHAKALSAAEKQLFADF